MIGWISRSFSIGPNRSIGRASDRFPECASSNPAWANNFPMASQYSFIMFTSYLYMTKFDELGLTVASWLFKWRRFRTIPSTNLFVLLYVRQMGRDGRFKWAWFIDMPKLTEKFYTVTININNSQTNNNYPHGLSTIYAQYNTIYLYIYIWKFTIYLFLFKLENYTLWVQY